MTATNGRITVVLKGYPRLSETFIAQEILGLERRGLALDLYSLRRPYDATDHPINAEIAASVTYLPEYLHRAPGRVVSAWHAARRLPGYGAAWAALRRDLARDRTRNRVRRFGQACVLATAMPDETRWLYAHFLHTPASVARYAAVMRDLPFSISAHAKDIWITPDWEKREKLAAACWLVTCTRYGADHLRQLADCADKVDLVYHGIDLDRFPALTTQPPARDGRDPDSPVTLLSVGRVVEKKGYDDLLAALRRLPPDCHWRLTHIGGGALRKRTMALAGQLGLAERITWLGAQPQTVVLERLRGADLFVLASRVAADGDRDGLPNVLMEAQSQGLACIATAVGGIPELIEEGATGRLVPPGDPAALAAALAGLIGDPAGRMRLGAAAQTRVREHFTMTAGLDRLAAKLGAEQPARLARADAAQ